MNIFHELWENFSCKENLQCVSKKNMNAGRGFEESGRRVNFQKIAFRKCTQSLQFFHNMCWKRREMWVQNPPELHCLSKDLQTMSSNCPAPMWFHTPSAYTNPWMSSWEVNICIQRQMPMGAAVWPLHVNTAGYRRNWQSKIHVILLASPGIFLG